MAMKRFLFVAFLFHVTLISGQHPGFVYLNETVPDIVLELKYYGSDNFMGCPVEGYVREVGIISHEAASALKLVQEVLSRQGLSLKIFDAYRPQKSVDHFIRWARNESDTLQKRSYYPNIPKSQLFKLGYISARSGHTRGSTLDCTLVDRSTGLEVDMGGPYDFFGEVSHHDYPAVTSQQLENRQLLKNAMEQFGFRAYAKEWWHYTLNNEPFPSTYFDFDIK